MTDSVNFQKAMRDWEQFCANDPDDYVDKNSPEHRAEVERQRAKMREHPLYGIF